MPFIQHPRFGVDEVDDVITGEIGHPAVPGLAIDTSPGLAWHGCCHKGFPGIELVAHLSFSGAVLYRF